jgi:hypothetical protein
MLDGQDNTQGPVLLTLVVALEALLDESTSFVEEDMVAELKRIVPSGALALTP